MKNIIAIRRKLIVVPPGNHDNSQLAASLQAELMALGYVLERWAFDAAARAPAEWLVGYHDEVIAYLKKSLGAGRPYQPIYRNFPREVMEMSHVRLFLNAVGHYLSNGKWEPPAALVERGMRFEKTEFTVLELAGEEKFLEIFTRLASLPQSLSQADKDALAWFADSYGGRLKLPAKIPFKETLCILAAKGMDVPMKLATDVLRVAVYMSGGDVSLPAVPKPVMPKPDWLAHYEKEPRYRQWVEQYRMTLTKAHAEARAKFKFRHFKRPERQRILSLLEKSSLEVGEMQLRVKRWLRLGEILHVGEHKKKFPRTYRAFMRLRNQNESRVRTFAGEVNLAFAASPEAGMKALARRPGEFARRLDWMIRSFDPRAVLETFGEIGGAVSAKVLFELYMHFAVRHLKDVPRTIMLKGVRARMKTLEPLAPLPQDLTAKVGNAVLGVCRKRIEKLPAMGRVWIDPRLKEVPIPSAMRSVNTTVKTYVRGTRIPFRAEAKVVRAFLHWFDEKGNEDLDLSVALYDGKFAAAGHISYSNLKMDALNCCHSGDVRHRQGSSAEYADIDIGRCLERGVRYGVVMAFNFDGRPMHTVKQCVFGLMEREHPRANEIFAPKTISNCMALANEAAGVIVCILDLERRQFVWADLETGGSLNLESARSSTAMILRSLMMTPKFSVHDLLSMHATGRGTIAATAEKAEEKLRWEDFVADYTRIASYMNF